jgi:hypothetical protein
MRALRTESPCLTLSPPPLSGGRSSSLLARSRPAAACGAAAVLVPLPERLSFAGPLFGTRTGRRLLRVVLLTALVVWAGLETVLFLWGHIEGTPGTQYNAGEYYQFCPLDALLSVTGPIDGACTDSTSRRDICPPPKRCSHSPRF